MNFTRGGVWQPKYRRGDVLRKEVGTFTIIGVDPGPCVYEVRVTESATHNDHTTRITEYFLDDLPDRKEGS